MPGAHVELERVDEARDERQLLGRTDRAADADRVVVGALPPGVDVLERLGEIEILERVVERRPVKPGRESATEIRAA